MNRVAWNIHRVISRNENSSEEKYKIDKKKKYKNSFDFRKKNENLSLPP